jgi:two-component system, cell cycle response regulator CpdR
MARILIAEDEEGLRSLVARALSQDGHAVVTANDGAEALDLLTRAQGAFELLLTDIRMPIMDGIALALAAARDHPHVAILLMTGFADRASARSGSTRSFTTSLPSRSRWPPSAMRCGMRSSPRRAGRCIRHQGIRVCGRDAGL